MNTLKKSLIILSSAIALDKALIQRISLQVFLNTTDLENEQ